MLKFVFEGQGVVVLVQDIIITITIDGVIIIIRGTVGIIISVIYDEVTASIIVVAVGCVNVNIIIIATCTIIICMLQYFVLVVADVGTVSVPTYVGLIVLLCTVDEDLHSFVEETI